MTSPEESTRDPVIEVLYEKSNLLVFAQGQEEYEQSMNRLFNRNPSNKPKAFIKPKDADEVCHVMQYASANQLQVSVLGGGHDPKGLAIIHDGLVLDMSALKDISIDVKSETAWVEAGVTVKELDDVTCPLGLAAVNGSCTDVGVIGLTLGGGFGFLSRTKGLAVHSCLQMEVATTTGQRILASQHEHEQLFWALRGAGHVGYGVVTKIQVKLHKLHEKYVGATCYEELGKHIKECRRTKRTLHAGFYWIVPRERVPETRQVVCWAKFLVMSHSTGRFCFLPMTSTKLREFLHVMNEFCREAEDEVTFSIYLITQIPGVAVDYFYDGPPCDAEIKLLPFLRSLKEKFGSPEENSSTADGSWQEQTTTYQEYQQRFGAEPEKTNKMWKSAFLRELTPEVIEIIINQLESAPVGSNPHTIGLELLGGEINRKSRDACAYEHRDALYLYSVQVTWKPQDEANGTAHACRQWAEVAGQSLLAHSLGSYQNYADCGEGTSQERLENYFGRANLQRLKELKREYDPHGVLHKEHFEFLKT